MKSLLRVVACLSLCVSLNSFGATLFFTKTYGGLYSYDLENNSMSPMLLSQSEFLDRASMTYHDGGIYFIHGDYIKKYNIDSGLVSNVTNTQGANYEGGLIFGDNKLFYNNYEQIKQYDFDSDSHTVLVYSPSVRDQGFSYFENKLYYTKTSEGRPRILDLDTNQLDYVSNSDFPITAYHRGLQRNTTGNKLYFTGEYLRSFDITNNTLSDITTSVDASYDGGFIADDNIFYYVNGEYIKSYDMDTDTETTILFGSNRETSIAYQPSPVPLPAGIYLFLSGLVGLGLMRGRRSKQL